MDKKEKLRREWIQEEKCAHIYGWDFSHIAGRYREEEDLPWDYESVIRRYLKKSKKLLDLDTGGGEFLLSLHHPYENTSATEMYPPNVQVCKERLLPLGICFKEADAGGRLPFEEESFDLVINRHGNFNLQEISRVLKKGGFFITQQVGAENDRELVELLFSKKLQLPFPDQYLDILKRKLQEQNFEVLYGDEAFSPIRFWDVGALVWFARIIEWEFPGFCVEKYLNELYHAQEILETDGCIEGRIHRFIIAARKRN